MATEMLLAWVADVAAFAAGVTTLIVLVGLIDRGLQGRVKQLIQGWLGTKDTRELARENGEKLDELHVDHRYTMGAQVALAKNQQQVVSALFEVNNISPENHPENLAVEEMEAYAMERNAVWPGKFYRGDHTD